MKKFLAILGIVTVLGGGGATAAVLLSNNATKYETTAVVTIEPTITIEFEPLAGYDNSVEVRWGSELFAHPSNVYNHDLALLAGALSAAAYDIENDNAELGKGRFIETAYKQMAIAEKDITLYSYKKNHLNITKLGSKKDNPYFNDDNFGDDNLAFSIASRPMEGGFHLLVLTMRGTRANDWATDAKYLGSEKFLGVDVNRGYYQFFERNVKIGLEEYMGRHKELQSGKLKVLITGHSLGGSCANLMAAWMNKEYSRVSADDVYAYTLAAPFNYNGDKSDDKNIFNIVNKKDIVPNSKTFTRLASSMLGGDPGEGTGSLGKFTKRFGIDAPPFDEGDKVGWEWHPAPIYIKNIKAMRDKDRIVPALESSVAAAQEADRLAREGESQRAAEEVSRAVEESKRQVEEAAAQRADDEIKAKLTKLAEEANQGAALGSLFSFGTLQTQVCAFGESRQKYGLIYKNQYTYNVVDVESERRNLQSTVNLQSAMFQSTLNTLKNEGIPNAAVRVQYLNRDGSMIYEQEFR